MSKFNFILLNLVYFLFLLFVYDFYISEAFAYEGFKNHFSINNTLESVVCISILAYFVVVNTVTVSGFFSVLILLIVFIPMAVLYSAASENSFAFYISFFSTLITVVLSWVCINGRFSLKIKKVYKGEKYFIYLCFIMIALFVIKILYTGAIFNLNFDTTLVYELRGQQEQLIYTGIWGYLTNWVVKVFTIVLIIYSAVKKNYALMLVLLVMQFIFYGVTTHKSTFFYAVISLFFYYVLALKNSIFNLVKYFIATLIICFLFAYMFGNVYVGSFLIRRALFVPAKLYYTYYDFFSFNDYVLWSNSFMSLLIDYPYDTSTAKVIGAYLGEPDLAANNGYIASGFMQAGIFGVIIYTLLLSSILFFLDSVSKSYSPKISCAIIIAPMISLLTSADLVTSMLSHGVLIAVVACYFLNSKEEL